MIAESVNSQLLSPSQRKLVEDNLGLVGVHLRRHVPNLVNPRREREYDDLFQEGCLGLIQAVKRFDPESGIPFAAFALARIRCAISRALASKFHLIHEPVRPRGREPSGDTDLNLPNSHRPKSRIKTQPFVEDCDEHYHDRHSSAARSEDAETISDRLRSKYERALESASESVAASKSKRGDLATLVRIVAEQRLRVPQAEHRRALRQIARDTKSSYARVAQCEKRLSHLVGALLDADPEFHELGEIARSCPEGKERAVDAEIEERLTKRCLGALLEQFRNAGESTKTKLLATLAEASCDDIERFVIDEFTALPPEKREIVLRKAGGPSH